VYRRNVEHMDGMYTPIYNHCYINSGLNFALKN
jgi:hypothetical protein